MIGGRKTGGLRSAIARLFSGPLAAGPAQTLIRSDKGQVFRVHATRRGGMGIVYLCSPQDEKSATPVVALKTFDDRYFFDPGMQQAVEVEARTWMRLSDQPFVMPLVGIISCDQKPHLLMPAVQPNHAGDVTLADEIRRTGTGLEPARAHSVALAVALGLRACVQTVPGLVHGDVKPDNMLLLGEGMPYLADFGTARIASRAGGPASVTGTAAYLAPECWGDGNRTSQASDVYAIGVTLFEMLAGRLPFVAAGGDLGALERAHRGEAPCFPMPPKDPLDEALRALALECLVKDPADRPATAVEVSDRLLAFGQELAPLETLTTMMAAAQYRSGVRGEPQMAVSRIEALLRQGDSQAALEIIEELPEEAVTGRLLQLHGTALSLAKRDEEAITVFERCLLVERDPAARASCQSEFGLSLKRLGRLEEARILYEGAIRTAPEESLLALRANHAATLQQLGRLDEAASILSKLSRQHADTATVWGMLGDVRSKMGEAAEAAAAMGQAIRIDPRDGSYRVMLAAIQLRGLRDAPAALETLDIAYGLGHHVPEWLVLTLACHMLLGRMDEAMGLLEAVRAEVPEENAMAMMREAAGIAAEVMKGEDGEPASEDCHTQDDAEDPPEGGGSPSGSPALAEEPPDDGRSVDEIRAAIRAGIQAHVQARMSAVDSTTIQDFYYGPGQPDYVAAFAEAMGEMRLARFNGLGDLRQRTTRHAFAQCPACGTIMLTQRDEGERYGCQGCGERVAVTRIATPELDALRERALAAAGLTPKGSGFGTSFVCVALRQPGQSEGVQSHFSEAGYERVEAPRRAIHDMFAMQAFERGFELPQAFDVWQRTQLPEETATGEDGTPEFLDRLLRETVREVGHFTTMSMAVADGEARDFLLAAPEDVYEKHLGGRDASPDSARDGRLLVETALRLGRLDDARAHSGRLALRFPGDPDAIAAEGVLALAHEDHQLAIDKLETALKLRPRDHGARARLLKAYEAAGDEDRARAVWNALKSHGAIPTRRRPSEGPE